MSDHKANPFAKGTSVRNVPRARDAYGRVLELGDEVIVPKLMAPRFRVQEIVPELAPGAPPNLVRITLGALIVLHAPADQPVGEFLRVRTAAEQGIAPPDQQPEEPVTSEPMAEPPLEGEPPPPPIVGPRLITEK